MRLVFGAWFGLSALSALLGSLACSSAGGGGGASPSGGGSAAATSSSGGSLAAGGAATGGLGQVIQAGTGSGSAPTTECTSDASLASARIWRLTDAEYVKAVRQLFGVIMPAQITSTDINTGDYTNFSELSRVSAGAVFAYETAARQAAQQAVLSHLAAFLPCGTTDSCVEKFVRNRIGRAFARPLADSEVTDLMAVYHAGSVDSPTVGVRLLIEATLQSPSFLYRTELGAATAGGPTGKVSLTPYETASALSYALQDSIPDEALWQKAVDGSLANPTVFAGEVDRLLAAPETQANLAHMAGYWLGIERLIGTEKSVALFPEFTEAFRAELYQSAQLFVKDVLASGRVSDLLTSKRLYLNENLAKVYGVSGVTGSQFVPVDLTSDERSGIITQPAVLAAFSRPDRGDPIHRGLFLYNALACGVAIGQPPPEATMVSASFPAGDTERQLSGRRMDLPICRSCHRYFDPLGLTTERYDPIGRYHGAVDASSTITGLGADLDGMVSGLPDLVAKLKNGRRVSDCAVTNLSVFVLGQTESTDKSCALRAVKDKFAETGSFKDFYRALLTSPAFVTRDPAPPAAAP